MSTFDIPRYPTSPMHLLGVREIFYSPEYSSPKEYQNMSRYKTTRCIVDDETRNIYHESYNEYVFNESDDDRYYTVNINTENRLDIISNIFYGSPLNWWIIAMCNDIIDPFNIEIDTVLRIPPITTLYEEGGVFNAK